MIARFFLALSFLFISACSRDSESGVNPGDVAPRDAFEDLAGNPVRLDQYRGKVVVLNFWASWCAPCEEEMPALERLYQTLKGEGLEVVAIGVDDHLAALKEFRDRIQVTFPVLFDRKGVAKNQFKITGFPETFILDREGRIQLMADPENGMPITRIVGPRRWESAKVVEALRRVLHEES